LSFIEVTGIALGLQANSLSLASAQLPVQW